MNVEISRARTAEAESILKLQYFCYQREAALYPGCHIPPLSQTLASLLAEFDSHRILAARVAEAVIGSVRARSDKETCFIGRLIVDPRFERRGIGSSLMHAIEAEFPLVVRYELFTGSRSEGNLRLYHRLGYREIRTEVASPGLTLVYLEKVAHC